MSVNMSLLELAHLYIQGLSPPPPSPIHGTTSKVYDTTTSSTNSIVQHSMTPSSISPSAVVAQYYMATNPSEKASPYLRHPPS